MKFIAKIWTEIEIATILKIEGFSYYNNTTEYSQEEGFIIKGGSVEVNEAFDIYEDERERDCESEGAKIDTTYNSPALAKLAFLLTGENPIICEFRSACIKNGEIVKGCRSMMADEATTVLYAIFS